MQYAYDDWGNMSIAFLASEDGEYIANANPLRYRGYYYDAETGYYYLQSRYYDPSICRFINADLPEYAQVQKNDCSGLNLFAYCCNDPVNMVDYDGYWGEKVHSGFNLETSNHYNSTKINKKKVYYGTYYWAVKCGFRKKYAKKLAKYCNDLDNYYPSAMYSVALVANASNNQVIYNAKQLSSYKKWQYWHFNGYKKGKKDTRREFASRRMKEAVKNWKGNHKEIALKKLGYGLHAIQDIEAHGQMGRGKSIPIQTFHADNIEYDWSNSSKTEVEKNAIEKKRLIATKKATYNYLNKFINKIGGKRKVQ